MLLRVEKTSQWVKTDKILGEGAICNLHLFYNFACMLHDNRIIIIIIIIKIKTLFIDLKKIRLFTDSRIWILKYIPYCTFFLCTKENCRKMTI